MSFHALTFARSRRSCLNTRPLGQYFQIKFHVQTASESHDLNMDFVSFDNGFKQLCIRNFKQE